MLVRLAALYLSREYALEPGHAIQAAADMVHIHHGVGAHGAEVAQIFRHLLGIIAIVDGIVVGLYRLLAVLGNDIGQGIGRGRAVDGEGTGRFDGEVLAVPVQLVDIDDSLGGALLHLHHVALHTEVVHRPIARAIEGVHAEVGTIERTSWEAGRTIVVEDILEVGAIEVVARVDGYGDEAFAILFAQEFNGAHTAGAPAAPRSRKFFHHNGTCGRFVLVHGHDGTFHLARIAHGHTIHLHDFCGQGQTHGRFGGGESRFYGSVAQELNGIITFGHCRLVAHGAAHLDIVDRAHTVVGEGCTKAAIFAQEGTCVRHILRLKLVVGQVVLALGHAVEEVAVAEVGVLVLRIAHVGIVKKSLGVVLLVPDEPGAIAVAHDDGHLHEFRCRFAEVHIEAHADIHGAGNLGIAGEVHHLGALNVHGMAGGIEGIGGGVGIHHVVIQAVYGAFGDNGLDGRNAVTLEVFHEFATIYRGEAEPITSMNGIEILFKDRIGHVEVGQPVVGLLHVFRARFDALGLGGGGRHHTLLLRGGKRLNALDGA